jgi:hypothetical protein
MLVPKIGNVIFDIKEDNVDDVMDKDKDQRSMDEGERVQLTKLCLIDLADSRSQMNVKKLRMVADKQTQLKRKTSQYIMERVTGIKE